MTSIDACYNEEAYLALLDAAIHDADPRDITSIDLSGNKINSATTVDISWKYLAAFPNLESFDIKANQMGPEGWNALYETLSSKCPRLAYLDISENGVLDESCYTLAKLLVELPHLRHLSIVTNGLSPRGIPTLCDGLRVADRLEELMLDYNMLGDEGCLFLCDALNASNSLRSLRKLGLSDNAIGDRGAAGLVRAVVLNPSSAVTSLNLSCNRIGDEGLALLGLAFAGKMKLRDQSTVEVKRWNVHLSHVDLSCNAAVTAVGNSALLEGAANWKAVRTIELCSMKLENIHFAALTAAIRSATSSLVCVEYFNNGGIDHDVEVALHDAIETCEKDYPVVEQTSNEPGPSNRAGWIPAAGPLLSFAGITTAVAIVVSVAAAKYLVRQRR